MKNSKRKSRELRGLLHTTSKETWEVERIASHHEKEKVERKLEKMKNETRRPPFIGDPCPKGSLMKGHHFIGIFAFPLKGWHPKALATWLN